MNNWILTMEHQPNDGVLVETKTDDLYGTRNKKILKKHKNLWFDSKNSVYVYYIPTHWRSIQSNKTS